MENSNPARNDKKLKPCPFCGGETDVYYSREMKRFFVVHKEIGAKCWCLMPLMLRGAQSLESAQEMWNRRVNENGES